MCCGKHESEVGGISWQGYCGPCGKLLMAENNDGIAAKQGPAHRRRMRGYARWIEQQGLDVPASRP